MMDGIQPNEEAASSSPLFLLGLNRRESQPTTTEQPNNNSNSHSNISRENSIGDEEGSTLPTLPFVPGTELQETFSSGSTVEPENSSTTATIKKTPSTGTASLLALIHQRPTSSTTNNNKMGINNVSTTTINKGRSTAKEHLDVDNELRPSNIQLLGKPTFHDRSSDGRTQKSYYLGFSLNGTLYKASDCCILTKKLKPQQLQQPQQTSTTETTKKNRNEGREDAENVVSSSDEEDNNSRREEEEEEAEYDNILVQIRSVCLKKRHQPSSLQQQQQQQTLPSSRVVIEVRRFARPSELAGGRRGYHSDKAVLQITPLLIHYISLESASHDVSLQPCQVLPLTKYCKLGNEVKNVYYYVDGESCRLDDKTKQYRLNGVNETEQDSSQPLSSTTSEGNNNNSNAKSSKISTDATDLSEPVASTKVAVVTTKTNVNNNNAAVASKPDVIVISDKAPSSPVPNYDDANNNVHNIDEVPESPPSQKRPMSPKPRQSQNQQKQTQANQRQEQQKTSLETQQKRKPEQSKEQQMVTTRQQQRRQQVNRTVDERKSNFEFTDFDEEELPSMARKMLQANMKAKSPKKAVASKKKSSSTVVVGSEEEEEEEVREKRRHPTMKKKEKSEDDDEEEEEEEEDEEEEDEEEGSEEEVEVDEDSEDEYNEEEEAKRPRKATTISRSTRKSTATSKGKSKRKSKSKSVVNRRRPATRRRESDEGEDDDEEEDLVVIDDEEEQDLINIDDRADEMEIEKQEAQRKVEAPMSPTRHSLRSPKKPVDDNKAEALKLLRSRHRSTTPEKKSPGRLRRLSDNTLTRTDSDGIILLNDSDSEEEALENKKKAQSLAVTRNPLVAHQIRSNRSRTARMNALYDDDFLYDKKPSEERMDLDMGLNDICDKKTKTRSVARYNTVDGDENEAEVQDDRYEDDRNWEPQPEEEEEQPQQPLVRSKYFHNQPSPTLPPTPTNTPTTSSSVWSKLLPKPNLMSLPTSISPPKTARVGGLTSPPPQQPQPQPPQPVKTPTRSLGPPSLLPPKRISPPQQKQPPMKEKDSWNENLLQFRPPSHVPTIINLDEDVNPQDTVPRVTTTSTTTSKKTSPPQYRDRLPMGAHVKRPLELIESMKKRSTEWPGGNRTRSLEGSDTTMNDETGRRPTKSSSASDIVKTYRHLESTVGAPLKALNSNQSRVHNKKKRSSDEAITAPLDEVDVPLMARLKRKRGEKTTKEDFIISSSQGVPLRIKKTSPPTSRSRSRYSNTEDSKFEFDKHEIDEELQALMAESSSDENTTTTGRRRKIPAILKGEYDDEDDDGADLEDFVVDDDEDPGYYQKSSVDVMLEDGDEEEDEDEVFVDKDQIDERVEGKDEDRSERLHPDIYRDDSNIVRYATVNDAFQVYVQFLSSCCLERGFGKTIEEERDPYFIGAIRRVENALFDRKELIVRSSVWTPAFQAALEERPIYRYYDWHSDMDCEACGRSNHPVSYKVELRGVRYDSMELWHNHVVHLLKIVKDEEEDGGEDEEEEDGGEAPQTYHLGKFCFSRTKLFHKIHHYKFHLLEKCFEKIRRTCPELLDDDDIELDDANNNNGSNDNARKLELQKQCLKSMLDDADWIAELFHEFDALMEETTRFNKSTNATEEKHRRE